MKDQTKIAVNADKTVEQALVAEIRTEAEANDGIKQITCRRNGNLAVRYENGFNNEWAAGYAGGNWTATNVKAILSR